MKLEFDENSEIIGTFIVRKNGIVTGLSAHEGKKVIVVLLPDRKEG